MTLRRRQEWRWKHSSQRTTCTSGAWGTDPSSLSSPAPLPASWEHRRWSRQWVHPHRASELGVRVPSWAVRALRSVQETTANATALWHRRANWFRCLTNSPMDLGIKAISGHLLLTLSFVSHLVEAQGGKRKILSLGITAISPSYSLYGLTGSHPLPEKRENLPCMLVILTNLNILTGVPWSAETTVLAAAPATDSSCRKKCCGAQNRKSFQFCSSNWHNPNEGVRVTSWGCRSFWVGPDSQGQPWLSWPLAEMVPVGLQAVLASLCLSPLPETDLHGVSEFGRRYDACLLCTAPCATAQSGAEQSHHPPTWRCFCLKLQSHEAQALVQVLSVTSHSEPAELQ